MTAGSQATLRSFAGDIADMPLLSAIAVLAFGAVIAGSFGPWLSGGVTNSAGYLVFRALPGTHGDGEISAIAAGVGIIAILFRTTWLFRRMLPGTAGMAAIACAGIGVYDWLHLHSKVPRLLYLGQHVDRVAWGITAVAAGGLVAVIALGAYEISYGMRQPPEPTWWERRRIRRTREWIDRQNALNQERERQELLTGQPQPVVRLRPPTSARTILTIVAAVLVVVVVVGVLVIAALHGFRPSGS